jgi:hypothetical protein
MVVVCITQSKTTCVCVTVKKILRHSHLFCFCPVQTMLSHLILIQYVVVYALGYFLLTVQGARSASYYLISRSRSSKMQIITRRMRLNSYLQRWDLNAFQVVQYSILNKDANRKETIKNNFIILMADRRQMY